MKRISTRLRRIVQNRPELWRFTVISGEAIPVWEFIHNVVLVNSQKISALEFEELSSIS